MTPEQIEAAYRYKEHQYRIEDAENQLDGNADWIEEEYGYSHDEIMDFADELAERFEDKFDCNVSENDDWVARIIVAPERYPGCHDHCEKLKAHRESDEYKKLCEYKNTYLKSHSTASSTQINKAMRYFKCKGYSLYGFKNVGSV